MSQVSLGSFAHTVAFHIMVLGARDSDMGYMGTGIALRAATQNGGCG